MYACHQHARYKYTGAGCIVVHSLVHTGIVQSPSPSLGGGHTVRQPCALLPQDSTTGVLQTTNYSRTGTPGGQAFQQCSFYLARMPQRLRPVKAKHSETEVWSAQCAQPAPTVALHGVLAQDAEISHVCCIQLHVCSNTSNGNLSHTPLPPGSVPEESHSILWEERHSSQVDGQSAVPPCVSKHNTMHARQGLSTSSDSLHASAYSASVGAPMYDNHNPW